MSRPLQSLLYCAAFLVATEVGLRLVEATAAPTRGVGVESPVVILGTSRSLRTLGPAFIEAELALAGLPEEWVANASAAALTNVGLYRRYLDEIHPWARAAQVRGVLAIEVRGSGMNDRYLTPSEQSWLAAADRERLPGAAALLGTESGLAALLARGEIEAASRALFWQAYLFRAPPAALLPLRRWLRPGWEDAEPPSGLGGSSDPGAGGAALAAPWASGTKGFHPFRAPPPKGLDESRWRDHYTRTLLRDFSVGGVQSEALRGLLQQAHEDGWLAVLYIMPLTELHLGFYADGDYARFLGEVKRIAELEGVPLVDFGSGHRFALDDFHDTHHLKPEHTAALSTAFARQAIEPALRALRAVEVERAD